MVPDLRRPHPSRSQLVVERTHAAGAIPHQHGIVDGDVLAISTPRGTLHAQARITGIRPGVLFVPFHYGYMNTRRIQDLVSTIGRMLHIASSR